MSCDNPGKEGVDLSEDAPSSSESPKQIISAVPSEKVQVYEQLLKQRTVIFRICIGVIIYLYGSFFYFVFCSNLYNHFVHYTPYATAVAVALIAVPSALLWGLVYSVYKIPEANKNDPDSDTLTEAGKVAAILAARSLHHM